MLDLVPGNNEIYLTPAGGRPPNTRSGSHPGSNRSRSHPRHAAPSACWNARKVGSPGGDGFRALSRKYPASAASTESTCCGSADAKTACSRRAVSVSHAGSLTRASTRRVRASNHDAPCAAHGQSTMTARSSRSMSTLSARRSTCASRSPPTDSAAAADRDSSRAWCSHRPRVEPGVRVIPQFRPALENIPHLVGQRRQDLKCRRRQRKCGDGVHGIEDSVKIGARQLRVPSINVAEHQGDPLAVVMRANKSRDGKAVGEQVMIRASLRCNCGDSEFSELVTAFTKKRLPLAVTTRSALPGEYPPDWECAAMTGLPTRCSTADRTVSGRSAHRTRERRSGVESGPGSGAGMPGAEAAARVSAGAAMEVLFVSGVRFGTGSLME